MLWVDLAAGKTWKPMNRIVLLLTLCREIDTAVPKFGDLMWAWSCQNERLPEPAPTRPRRMSAWDSSNIKCLQAIESVSITGFLSVDEPYRETAPRGQLKMQPPSWNGSGVPILFILFTNLTGVVRMQIWVFYRQKTGTWKHITYQFQPET